VKQITNQHVPDWYWNQIQTLCQNLAYSKWRTACSAPPTYTSTGPQYLQEKNNFKVGGEIQSARNCASKI